MTRKAGWIAVAVVAALGVGGIATADARRHPDAHGLDEFAYLEGIAQTVIDRYNAGQAAPLDPSCDHSGMTASLPYFFSQRASRGAITLGPLRSEVTDGSQSQIVWGASYDKAATDTTVTALLYNDGEWHVCGVG